MGELVGDPEKEEDFLKERSPITYVDKVKSTVNLLIIQGANDTTSITLLSYPSCLTVNRKSSNTSLRLLVYRMYKTEASTGDSYTCVILFIY
jgi:hypothetical protein